MKKLILYTALFLIFSPLLARKTTVLTASQINSGSWSAGDTIVMKNGTWSDQSISFSAIGTLAQPVVLMAETPGSVILTGSSKLAFSGKYIVISGLYFKDGTLSGSDIISFRLSSSDMAENCRLTNTAIANYNPSLNTVDSKWVSLYGKNNQVDHCSFENKTNSGTLMVVWLQSGIVPSHTIDSNYFGYRNSNLDANGAELNGQEIIRLGDSSTSMQTASVLVTNNFFEHCNGEIEIVSNKSCGNYYSNNVFFECHGMLTLRHGNGCTVDGNYFFGNGVSESGGVRIIGENHKVYNNYFEKLRGTGYRAALCIVRGKENSLANEYFQVKNALVAFNTMVDCSLAFNVNYNSSTTCLMPPINTTIAHNQVYNTSTSNVNVNIDTTNSAAMSLSWLNNLMNKGSYSNFSYTSSQVITGKDAKMTQVSTTIPMYEPGTSSALSTYVTSDYSEIGVDIRGRVRAAGSKIPGASQLNGTFSREMPQKTKVGALFLNGTTTDVGNLIVEDESNIKIVDSKLTLNVGHDGVLKLYSMSGNCMMDIKLISGKHSFSIQPGVYIVRYQSAYSNITKKIFIY